jgi:transcriptional regulator with XRE-family HTH domain
MPPTMRGMSIADRIDGELRRLGYSNPAAGMRLDVSKETVRNLRGGKTEPTASVLMKLAEMSGRSVEWFVYGREPEPGLTDDERMLVRQFRHYAVTRGLRVEEAIDRLGWGLAPASSVAPSPAPSPPVAAEAPESLAPRPLAGSVDLTDLSNRRIAQDRARRRGRHANHED